ncbi:DUF2303 family protein [Vibrio sp. ER1A]|uniref:DUF2303 family protein n=1 Tax=Vibrio sp. ER1A TaxID=1517681 RepID=UPI0004DCEB97|nr:DUF2303 family protein [Vibrio sp. ER1A]KFA99444.1 hypothetical protein HW45_03520 [Vibrio sp. ER1A]
MSLDKAAIQELVNKANAPLFLDQIKESNTKSTIIALPNDYVMKDLEEFKTHRDSFRGTFKTGLITEIAKYAKVYSAEGSAAFVDVDFMSAEITFDIGTVELPLHQRHTAKCALKKTAPFKTLLGVNGHKMDQRQIAEWLEDYSEYLTPISGGENPLDMTQAITALRELNFERVSGSDRAVSNFASSQSEYEREAVTTKGELVIPDGFVFECVPYQGLASRKFEMRLSIIKNEILILRIKRLEEIQEEMALEFKDTLLTEFQTNEIKMPIYIGEF